MAGIKVLKFGGSVLRDENDLPLAVHEIYRHWRQGFRVLAVVSAFGDTTDDLLERSKAFGEKPQPGALAELLLTGEATSAALLTMTLDRAGIPAKLLNGAQARIRTEGDPLDGEPVTIDTERVMSELESAVVVISGFGGIDAGGGPTLLGRGGLLGLVSCPKPRSIVHPGERRSRTFRIRSGIRYRHPTSVRAGKLRNRLAPRRRSGPAEICPLRREAQFDH